MFGRLPKLMKPIQKILLVAILLLIPGCCSKRPHNGVYTDANDFQTEFPVEYITLDEARSIFSVALQGDVPVKETTIKGKRTFIINSKSRHFIDQCIAILSDIDVSNIDTYHYVDFPDYLSALVVANQFEINTPQRNEIQFIPDSRTNRIQILGRNRENINLALKSLTTWLDSQKP